MSDSARGLLVISPHLDDAALSASHRLRTAGAVVVTVCAALPSSDTSPGWWDRLTRASSARERQQERIAEDQAAMRFVHARAVHLEHLDGQYRDGLALDVEAVAADLELLTAAATEVWLPAGIGHEDHMAVRDAGMLAARDRGQRSAVLYADVPHAVPYGWPAWVTGHEPAATLDVDAWLDDELRRAGLDPARLTPRPVRLDAEAQAFKRELIGHYPTQLAALQLDDQHLACDPAILEHEATWICEL